MTATAQHTATRQLFVDRFELATEFITYGEENIIYVYMMSATGYRKRVRLENLIASYLCYFQLAQQTLLWQLLADYTALDDSDIFQHKSLLRRYTQCVKHMSSQHP